MVQTLRQILPQYSSYHNLHLLAVRAVLGEAGAVAVEGVESAIEKSVSTLAAPALAGRSCWFALDSPGPLDAVEEALLRPMLVLAEEHFHKAQES